MKRFFDREGIERAEKIASRLEHNRLNGERERLHVEALAEAQLWVRPESLRSRPLKRAKKKPYEFTEAQMLIALRSLNAGGAV
jgi:hypothetical protein